MSRRIAAKITGVGGYVPPRVMSNAELEKLVDTNDAWIRERTGIRERHVADSGVATSDLATAAAKILLESRGMSPEEIDLIVVASVTPDMMFPATACLVQDKLGATNAWGFDLSAACSGFVYALTVGAQFGNLPRVTYRMKETSGNLTKSVLRLNRPRRRENVEPRSWKAQP